MNLINGCYGYGYSGIPTNLMVKELVFNYLGSLDIDSYLTNTIIKAAEEATARANAAAELAENIDVSQLQLDLDTQKLDTGITATAKYGGFNRTLSSKLAEQVSIKDHGAIGDGTVHPLSEIFETLTAAQIAYANITITSLTQTIDWAATQSALNSGVFSVYVPDGTYCMSDTIKVPKNVHLHGAGIGYFYSHPVNFIFVGVGSKDYIMEGVTDTVYQVANPSIGAAYLADSGTRGDVYKLNNYAENFSVCVEVLEASQLSNVFITVDNDGVAGYTNNSSNTLAKDWDVGLLCCNANSALISRVWSFGHFAKAGVLVTAHSFTGDTAIPSSELLRFSECGFSGQFGVSVRTQDTVVGNNWGFGGTVFDKCYIRGMEQNLRLATSDYYTNPSDRPSGALEMSGGVMRGISFNTCTFITRQDIMMMFGKATDMNFNNCYEESKQVSVNSVWQPTSTGSRIVSSADTIVNFKSNEKYGVDFSPNMSKESSASRYTGTGAASTLSLIYDDNYTMQNFISYQAHKLRSTTDWFGIADHTGQISLKMLGTGEVNFYNSNYDPIISRRDSLGATQRILWVSKTSGDIQHYGTMYPSLDKTYSMGVATKRYSVVHSEKFSSYGLNQNPLVNGELVVTVDSDTQASIRVKGTDGVIRKAILTLA